MDYEKSMKQYNASYTQYMSAKSRVKTLHQEKSGASGRKAASDPLAGVFIQPIEEEDPFELAGKRMTAIRYGKWSRELLNPSNFGFR